MFYCGNYLYNDQLHMEEKHVEELIESVKLAQQGYWMPFAVIAALFGIIIFLLIAHWRKSEAYHHEKHKENDKRYEKYVTEMTEIAIMVRVHEAEIENLKDRE